MTEVNYLNFDDECWGPKAEKISIWHFDPTVKDKEEDVFLRVCHFDNDFTEDVAKAKEQLLTTTSHHLDFWYSLGYKSKLYATDSTKRLNLKEYPQFKDVVEKLGLIDHEEYPIRTKLFRQQPGQILPSHIDNYKTPTGEKTDEMALKAVRFAVALSDWNVGHYWHFGNAVWQQWKTGECVHWHRTMAHGTANVGHTERLTLQITGVPGEKTLELLNNRKW